MACTGARHCWFISPPLPVATPARHRHLSRLVACSDSCQPWLTQVFTLGGAYLYHDRFLLKENSDFLKCCSQVSTPTTTVCALSNFIFQRRACSTRPRLKTRSCCRATESDMLVVSILYAALSCITAHAAAESINPINCDPVNFWPWGGTKRRDTKVMTSQSDGIFKIWWRGR